MSIRTAELHAWRAHAPLFAALGDETRLALVARLAGGRARSIAELTEGSEITRQAVAKHVRVLEDAGLVRRERAGRESRIALDPEPLEELRGFLEAASKRWDRTLERLKDFVET